MTVCRHDIKAIKRFILQQQLSDGLLFSYYNLKNIRHKRERTRRKKSNISRAKEYVLATFFDFNRFQKKTKKMRITRTITPYVSRQLITGTINITILLFVIIPFFFLSEKAYNEFPKKKDVDRTKVCSVGYFNVKPNGT